MLTGPIIRFYFFNKPYILPLLFPSLFIQRLFLFFLHKKTELNSPLAFMWEWWWSIPKMKYILFKLETYDSSQFYFFNCTSMCMYVIRCYKCIVMRSYRKFRWQKGHNNVLKQKNSVHTNDDLTIFQKGKLHIICTYKIHSYVYRLVQFLSWNWSKLYQSKTSRHDPHVLSFLLIVSTTAI